MFVFECLEAALLISSFVAHLLGEFWESQGANKRESEVHF